MPKVIQRTVKEVYELWLEALRSGKYKQVDGALKGRLDTGKMGFCCLGVLCDLAAKDGGDKWEASESSDILYYKYESGQLPDVMRKFLKITEKQQEYLIEMNDNLGAKFPKIADYIETKIMPTALKKSKVLW